MNLSQIILTCTLCLAASLLHGQTTENDVIWSGGAGVGNPYWNVSENWAGGEAPANPTPGALSFLEDGQAVISVVEQDRTIGGLTCGMSGPEIAHTIDLGNNTLSITGKLTVAKNQPAQRNTLTVTNGTLQIGTVGNPGRIDILGPGTLNIAPGTSFDTTYLDTFSVGGDRSNIFDLRGAEIVTGILSARQWLIPGSGYYGTLVYMDNTTVIDTFVATELFEIGKANCNQINPQYMGDPADTFTMDGLTFGKLPANVNINFGLSQDERADALIAEHTLDAGRALAAIRASSGGTFVAWLSTLKIGTRNGTGARRPRGMLHLAEMDSCMLDVHDLFIAPGREDALSSDNEQGEIWLPPGTATIGNAVIGAPQGLGHGIMFANNTVITITNFLALRTTGQITLIRANAEPGLIIERGFEDHGGTMTVHFMEPPTEGATNCAIRIHGDSLAMLGSMEGAGRLVSAVEHEGKKTGVIYRSDIDETWYIMVDDNLPFPPIASAHDSLTIELEPGGTVILDVHDVDNGSYDPDGRPFTLTISADGGPAATNLTFTSTGDYTVTLNIQADGDEAVDTCVVHIVNLHPGAEDDLTWSGEAPTALMDRREWFWSGNWTGEIPPANPTPGTISFLEDGQAVISVVEQDRTIGGLTCGMSGPEIAHTIDLGNNTLSITGKLTVAKNQPAQRNTLTVTNGTLQIGTVGNPGRIDILGPGTLNIAPGTSFDATYLDTFSVGGDRNNILDLRGAEIVASILSARQWLIPGSGWYGTVVYMDATTLIDSFVATELFEIGKANCNQINPQYMGDPADTFTMDGLTFGKLPANVNIKFGLSPDERAAALIAEHTVDAGRALAAIRASSGGTFVAWLSTLKIGTRSGTGARRPRGMLHLAEMDSCMLDVHDLFIAPGRENAEATDDERGELHLPPGTATVGNAVIGAVDGVGIALLSTSNTTFIVTNSIAFNKTAQADFTVTGTSSGLDIRNPEPNALTVADGAALTITFTEPAQENPFFGLRWTGSHVDDIQAMIDDSRLIVDNSGLGREISIFAIRGATWLGLMPDAGTTIMFH